MKLNINWKKTFLVAFDLVIVAYLVMALTSWNRPSRENAVCTKVVIDIADENVNGFLNSAEVKVLLERSRLYPLSKRMDDINPRQIEQALKGMPFVKTAQCYATDDNHVCITITQRTPIVRVKSMNGDDYYIDDNGGVMPNSQYTSDMIIVTGSVSPQYACQYVYLLAQELMGDDLWRNQVEQVNILPDKTVELVPRVGNHVINIGQLPTAATNAERSDAVAAFVKKQMHRLELFYREGLKYAGWERYEYISLEYSNQIVCRKRESN